MLSSSSTWKGVARTYVALCPAKINTVLRVGQPDARGYHPLETEFQAIGLCDELVVVEGGSGFAVEGADLPPENTVTKALRLMREVATLPPIGIQLTKRIPSEAGLGGGSSDAAGLLRILRKLLPPSVPNREFELVARAVGADVSFFLVGGRASATGYGEVLTPLPDVAEQWMVVAMPHVRCSTPAMYRALDEARSARGVAPSLGAHMVENDFHAVAPEACLNLANELAAAGLDPVGLSGSGAAVFGFAGAQDLAESVVSSLPHAWAVPTLTREQSIAVVEG